MPRRRTLSPSCCRRCESGGTGSIFLFSYPQGCLICAPTTGLALVCCPCAQQLVRNRVSSPSLASDPRASSLTCGRYQGLGGGHLSLRPRWQMRQWGGVSSAAAMPSVQAHLHPNNRISSSMLSRQVQASGRGWGCLSFLQVPGSALLLQYPVRAWLAQHVPPPPPQTSINMVPMIPCVKTGHGHQWTSAGPQTHT